MLAAVLSRCLSAASADWMMSLTGIVQGVRAKFSTDADNTSAWVQCS